MADFQIVGAPVARADGPDKVSVRKTYAADVQLPGTLWGKILRSPFARARIRHVDATEKIHQALTRRS